MTQIDSVSEDLFFKLRNRFPNVAMGNEQGKATVDPFSARFFNFAFEEQSKNFGVVTCSVIDNQSLKVYFSQDITENMEQETQDSWFGFLRELRRFAKSHMLMFDVRDITKPQLDQKDIEFISQYSRNKNSIAESRVAWERKGRYSDGHMNTVKIHVVHKNKMDENPHNRLSQVDKIYLVNSNAERFLLPFKSVLGAKAMAQYVARGGNPYDESGQAIAKAIGEMRSLQRFNMATKNKQYEDEKTQQVLVASKHIKEEIRKCLVRMSNGRHFEESIDKVSELVKIDDPKVSEEIKNWFIQKYYNENLNNWIESAALAYKKYEEHQMSNMQEAKGSVIQKVMDPNFKLVLKKDPAIDQMMASSKYSDQNGLITRVLSDVAERIITPNDDDVANFAAKMADVISSEGAAFGQRMTDDYKKEKALAVRLVAKYVGDMNKIKSDSDYASEVRKDPSETMGGKKDRYGKVKGESAEFESFINDLGETDEEEMMDQIAADEEGFGAVTEEPNEGNEFSGALAKAKDAGKDEFEVGGKKYKVNEAEKPDFLDLDKDGDKKEAMAKAVKDKEIKMKEQDLRRLAGLPISEVEETNQTTEAIDPIKAKLGQVIDKYFGQIYDYGDNGLEYLNRNGAFWTALYDKHDGDIDAIINNEDVMVLRRAAQELKDIAGDLKYELSEADSYSIRNTETDNTYHISKYPITANHSIYKKIKTKDPQAQIYKNGQPVKEANECDNSMPMPQSPMHAQDSGVNISTNMNTKTGNKSITITADGEAAEQLAQMLKMAGMR